MRVWGQVWLWSVLLLAIVGPVSVRATPMMYADPAGRFSLTVPDGWVRDLQTQADVSFTLPGMRGSQVAFFDIRVRTVTATRFTIDDVANAAQASLKRDNAGIAGVQPLLVWGLPARRIDSIQTFNDGGAQYVIHDVLTVVAQGSTIYLLDFSTLDQNFNDYSGGLTPFLDGFQLPYAPPAIAPVRTPAQSSGFTVVTPTPSPMPSPTPVGA